MEEAEFAAFYRETYPRLRAYVTKSVGEVAVADDIAQESYVRLLQVVRRASEPRQTKAYLYQIATNLMRDHWRRGTREVQADDQDTERATSASPDLGIDLNGAFEQLTNNERMLLWLAHVEGYNHRDIATTLKLREGSVRVLLFRARRRFSDLLRSMGFEPEE